MPQQDDAATAPKIDTHVHYLTKEYRESAQQGGHAQPDGFPVLPTWDPSSALEEMDRLGIGTSILSVSSPGVHFGDDAGARRLARNVNEAAAELAREHPDRFGFFASLPLPDLDGAAEELHYALDTLHADGVVLLSNHRGLYPGTPPLRELFGELNLRGTVVFLHPASPMNWEHLIPGVPRPMMEFLFETTRTVVNLVISGTLDACPDIELVIPHAGAALGVLADRVVGLLEIVPELGQVPSDRVLPALGRLWYDLAGFSTPRQLLVLREIVDPSRLLYGTDRPFANADHGAENQERLDRTPLLGDAERRAMYRDNALRLLPRLTEAS
jgi:predicted TIM-barrel fold metal-dependent hydrolase